MNTEIFTICDFANSDSGGKLNVIGSFDHIFSREVPIVHPSCSIAAKMRFAQIEVGQKRISISFVNSDGKAVLPPFSQQIDVMLRPGESTAIAQLVVTMQQLQLPSLGEYSIDLAVDGRQEASIPLYAVQLQSVMPPPQLPG
jgi:hypothetical protein